MGKNRIAQVLMEAAQQQIPSDSVLVADKVEFNIFQIWDWAAVLFSVTTTFKSSIVKNCMCCRYIFLPLLVLKGTLKKSFILFLSFHAQSSLKMQQQKPDVSKWLLLQGR